MMTNVSVSCLERNITEAFHRNQNRKEISFAGLVGGNVVDCSVQVEMCFSVLPVCPEVKVNEIITAANLLPSPTVPNEPQLRSISRR